MRDGDVRVGDVVEVSDRNDTYGTGRLILRVSAIGDLRRSADGNWLDIEGYELHADGTQVSPRPRLAVVRVGAVRVRPAPNTQPGDTESVSQPWRRGGT